MKKKNKTCLKNQSIENLYKAITSLTEVKDLEQFLADLCTPVELTAMADRWLVAAEIFAGKPYRQIHEETGVSITTIGRVARCINYGAGGYQRVHQLLRDIYEKC